MWVTDHGGSGNAGGGPWPWVFALAGMGLLQRAAMLTISAPTRFGDTPTYWRLAGVLADRGWSAYDATRVPGYPMFIGLLGQEEESVWLAQLALGLTSSLILFALAQWLTGSPPVAFAVAALYDLAPGQFLFESNLLSESLTTFLVLASLALFALLQESEDGWKRLVLAAILGWLASLAGLVRTLFFFLPLILLPFVLCVPDRWRDRLRIGAVFSLAPIVLLGGWIFFVYDHYDMLSPTTMGGYHLVQHTGAFFEYLPDEEAVIRDTYLEYRKARIAERDVQTNAIWEAIPTLSERTGLSFFGLSARLQELSLQLIRQHPDLYLRSVAEGWISFWKAPVYWQPDLFPPAVASFLSIWKWVGRGAFLVANGLFLAGSLLVVVSRKIRLALRPPVFVYLSASLVLISSVIQTLVDHGDNPRFLVPLQMVVVLVMAWGCYQTWLLWLARPGAAT